MSYNIDNAKKVLVALVQAGAKPSMLPLLMSQVAVETGDFDSNQFRINNNASGITFSTSGKQKNATRGNPLPMREQPIVNGKRVIKYYYAKFPTLKDWAIDYLRIVNRSVTTATDVVDYAKKLKAQRYYADTLQNYIRAIQGHFERLKKLGLFEIPANVITTVDDKKKIG